MANTKIPLKILNGIQIDQLLYHNNSLHFPVQNELHVTSHFGLEGKKIKYIFQKEFEGDTTLSYTVDMFKIQIMTSW